MNKIAANLDKAPLYILPGATRSADRVIPAELLRIGTQRGTSNLLVTVEGEEQIVLPRVFACMFHPGWADSEYFLNGMGNVFVQGDPLPDGDVQGASQRTWFATADGCVYSARMRDDGGYPAVVQQLQVRVDRDWIANALEPSRRQSAVRMVVVKCLEDQGWSLGAGVAIGKKAFDTAVGERVAFAYLGPFNKERCNCPLSGDDQSEGRNVLESHGVLIPWDASVGEMWSLTRQFAANVDEAVGQSYATRLLQLGVERGG